MGMFIQRIKRDDHFFSRTEEQAQYDLFQSDSASAMKGDTSRSDTVTILPESATTKQFCYCWKGDEGLMAACDNPNCSITWFH